MALLQDIALGKNKLKHVRTTCTTADGKQQSIQYIEERGQDGRVTVVEKVDADSLGFCPDNSPDKVVGVATNGLLVGSQDIAYDFDLLKLHGVTHVLNVGCGIPNAFEDKLKYLTVNMLDTPEESFSVHYDECKEFIDKGRTSGVVLVHCNAGCSRSVTVALAYVIHNERISLEEALMRLRETRPAARPNDGFMKQLEQWAQLKNRSTH